MISFLKKKKEEERKKERTKNYFSDELEYGLYIALQQSFAAWIQDWIMGCFDTTVLVFTALVKKAEAI